MPDALHHSESHQCAWISDRMPGSCIAVAVVHANEQQQRVVGQLVLGLRESRLLAGARDIDYTLDEHGVITIDWVEGPYADEVAVGLAAYSAAGLLDVDAIAPNRTGNHLRAEILVSELPVVLLAYEPLGLERAKRVARAKRRAPQWKWPSPLEQPATRCCGPKTRTRAPSPPSCASQSILPTGGMRTALSSCCRTRTPPLACGWNGGRSSTARGRSARSCCGGSA